MMAVAVMSDDDGGDSDSDDNDVKKITHIQKKSSYLNKSTQTISTLSRTLNPNHEQ
jgi:hypothetical protein